jgi:hypothetical protein
MFIGVNNPSTMYNIRSVFRRLVRHGFNGFRQAPYCYKRTCLIFSNINNASLPLFQFPFPFMFVLCARSLYDIRVCKYDTLICNLNFLTLTLSLLALYNYRNLRNFTTEKIFYCGGAVKIILFVMRV